MKDTEEIFKYGNIRIITHRTSLGKFVTVTIEHDDYFETIDSSDRRAHDAFIALHNSKWSV